MLEEDFTNFWQETRTVPCKGCTLCCHDDVELRPQNGDDPEKYETELYMNHIGNPSLRLKKKPNGECFYLAGTECSIHADRPLVCRSYDCRVAYLSFTRAQREQHKGDLKFKAGEQRLHTLETRGRRAAIMVRKWREHAWQFSANMYRTIKDKPKPTLPDFLKDWEKGRKP